MEIDRRGLVVVAVALLCSLAAITYAGYANSRARHSAAPGSTAAVLGSSTPAVTGAQSPLPSAAPSAQPSPSAPTRAIGFLGDGWMLGAGTPCGAPCGFAELAAKELGLRPVEDAIAGTGYSNGGGSTIPGPDPFGSRLAHFESLKPDIVVIAGGQADAPFTQANIKASTTALFNRIKQDLRGTPVVVIGPFSATGPASAEALSARDTIQAAATAAGFLFVDPIDEQWITGSQNAPGSGNAPQYISGNGLDPTPEGHKYLAGRLSAALRKLKVA